MGSENISVALFYSGLLIGMLVVLSSSMFTGTLFRIIDNSAKKHNLSIDKALAIDWVLSFSSVVILVILVFNFKSSFDFVL